MQNVLLTEMPVSAALKGGFESMDRHTWIKLTILAGICVLLLWPFSAAAQSPEPAQETTVVDLTFLDMAYGDRVLGADGAFVRYSLYMPQKFELSEESYLELFFDYFMSEATIPAELEVSINGAPLGRFTFPQEETLAPDQVPIYRLPLGETDLQPGYNGLQITLDSHEICDSYEPEVEVVIGDNSYFHLVYGTPSLSPELQAYPYPFYERTFSPSQLYLVLPEQPSSADLSAAATISAGLGRMAGVAERLVITPTLDIGVTPQIRGNYNLIVIGQLGRNRLMDELGLSLDRRSIEIEPDDGLLQVLPSPWNPARAVLVVTGQSDEALYRASAALNRPSYLPGLQGRVGIIKDVLPPPPEADAQQDIERTFDELGYQDETFYGIAANRAIYYFFLPRTWQRLEAPRLFLSFGHSPLLDSANSTLDVLLDRTPIGGTLLDGTNQTNGVLELELPGWLLKPGLNRLDIQVQMHLPNEHCVDQSDTRAWAVVYKNSYLSLPLVAGEIDADLAFFPAPFNGQGHYTESVIVVPDEMSISHARALMRLAAHLGASGESDYLALQVVRASEVSEQIKAEKNLIVLGRPTRNLLLQDQAIAGALPQPFEPGTDTLLPKHDTVIVQQLPGWSIGLLQEFPSPWNPQQTVLAITGTSDESVEWGMDALRSSSQSLLGNLAVVDAEGIRYALDVRGGSAQPALPAQINVVPVGQDAEHLQSLSEKWW